MKVSRSTRRRRRIPGRPLTLSLVLGAALSAVVSSARAAPDQTLGMALMSARVHWNGTLFDGAGAVSVTPEGTSGYFVLFRRSVEGCTYVASLGWPNASSFWPGQVSTTGVLRSSGYGVLVRTFDPTGDELQRPFMLIVFCAQ